jgi:hypothetical protein
MKENLLTFNLKQRFKFKNLYNKFYITKFYLNFLILSIILISIIQTINSQDDFENLQREIYPGAEMPYERLGGAHPGYRNLDFANEFDDIEHRINNPRGGMHGYNHRQEMRGRGRRHNINGINQHFNGMQDNIVGNTNSRSYGPFGIFSNSWMNTLYEMMMMLFFFSFVYNCLCGNNKNDKYALAWYNANKQYFEERYSNIGLKKEEDVNGIQDIETNSLPIIKDSQYIYKFYASGYRYIKWLMVVLEFRKRHDLFSVFSTYIFSQKDRIVFEVGIEPLVEESGWVFCVCNKRDGPTLARDYQDINFFCSTSVPSNMSDKLILYSESEELYCDLFQNRVNYLFKFNFNKLFFRIYLVTIKKLKNILISFILRISKHSAKSKFK